MSRADDIVADASLARAGEQTVTREQVLEAVARVADPADRENITAAFYALEKYAFDLVAECPVCGAELHEEATDQDESNGGA